MLRGRGRLVFDLVCIAIGGFGLVYGIVRIGGVDDGPFMGILLTVMAVFVGTGGMSRLLARRRAHRERSDRAE